MPAASPFRIPLVKPYLPPGTQASVAEVLDSGFLTEGPLTHALEEQFRAVIGCRHALAVTSCTTGLEIALRALKIGPGDEVIVPDYTYPATADAVAIVGATPVIVDIDPRTMLIDLGAAEAAITPRTKAIMPVSEFGNPLDHDRLGTMARRHGLLVVEDAACAFGSEFKGRMTGALADITVFSLHPRKTITSGEGGVVTTDRAEWAAWMESYKHFGMGIEDGRLVTRFDRIGTNYKLSNILAAVALAQMECAGAIIARRRDLAARYTQALQERPGIVIPAVTAGGTHSFQTFCVGVERRDEVMQALRAQGIEAQIGTYALHLQPAFRDARVCRLCEPFPHSRHAYEHCLALPLFHTMTEEAQESVVRGLCAAVG